MQPGTALRYFKMFFCLVFSRIGVGFGFLILIALGIVLYLRFDLTGSTKSAVLRPGGNGMPSFAAHSCTSSKAGSPSAQASFVRNLSQGMQTLYLDHLPPHAPLTRLYRVPGLISR
jgi:hypothetical protein